MSTINEFISNSNVTNVFRSDDDDDIIVIHNNIVSNKINSDGGTHVFESPLLKIESIVLKETGPKGDKGDPGQLVSDIFNMVNPAYPITKKIYHYSGDGEISSINIYSEDVITLLFTKSFFYNDDGSISKIITVDRTENVTLTKNFSYVGGNISNIDTFFEGL